MPSSPAQPPRAAVLKTCVAEVCPLAQTSVLAGLRAGQAPRRRRVATPRDRAWRHEVRTSGGELPGHVPPADAAAALPPAAPAGR